MKTLSLMGFALLLVVGLVAPAAAETTLSGTISCAKCALKKADASGCQDVLVVKGENGATTEYYISKNAAASEAGHACTEPYAAKVTGEVAEKNGKKWLTASKIEKQG